VERPYKSQFGKRFCQKRLNFFHQRPLYPPPYPPGPPKGLKNSSCAPARSSTRTAGPTTHPARVATAHHDIAGERGRKLPQGRRLPRRRRRASPPPLRSFLHSFRLRGHVRREGMRGALLLWRARPPVVPLTGDSSHRETTLSGMLLASWAPAPSLLDRGEPRVPPAAPRRLCCAVVSFVGAKSQLASASGAEPGDVVSARRLDDAGVR
jgi:hypothetical protein